MNKLNLLMVVMVVMVVTFVSGCAESSALIRRSSTSVRADVFKELTDGGTVPQDYADLRIAFSLKTHKPGIYSARDIHGTPEYKLLVNIDGQVIQLQGGLSEENTEQTALRNPEAGEGIRYRFNSNLRLKAGTHRIVIAIPADGLAEAQEITLTEGSSNSLVLEPVYKTISRKQRPGFYGVTRFTEGLKGFRMVLNGKEM